MRAFRIDTLQWAAAALCGLMGTLLLVAPHRMPFLSGSPLAPYLWWLAVALTATGGGLAGIALLRPRGAIATGVHVAAGTLLLLVSGSLAGVGAWFPGVAFGTFALATLVAPLVAVQPAGPLPDGGISRETAGRDLFAFQAGVANSLIGLVLLGLPSLV